MDLCVNLVTRPVPGMWTRVVVLIVVVIAVVVLWQAGYSLPDATTLVLGTGYTCARVARSLIPDASAPQVHR